MKVSFRLTSDAMRKLFDKIYKTCFPFVSLLSIKICGITRCTRIGKNTIQVWVVTKPREQQQFSKINRNRFHTQAIQRQTPFCFARKTAFWWLAQPLSSVRHQATKLSLLFSADAGFILLIDFFSVLLPKRKKKAALQLYKPTHTHTALHIIVLLYSTSYYLLLQRANVCACVCLMYGLLVFVCARDFGFPSSLSDWCVHKSH